jgi:hypothetical protein
MHLILFLGRNDELTSFAYSQGRFTTTLLLNVSETPLPRNVGSYCFPMTFPWLHASLVGMLEDIWIVRRRANAPCYARHVDRFDQV